MTDAEKLRVMAAAVYEIRLLLGAYRSTPTDDGPGIDLAANLAYMLHNHALDVLERRSSEDWDEIPGRLRLSEERIGARYADGYDALIGRSPAAPTPDA